MAVLRNATEIQRFFSSRLFCLVLLLLSGVPTIIDEPGFSVMFTA